MKMVYHSFSWWLLIDFQTPVSLFSVGSTCRLMQRMGITGAKSYIRGHDEGIWSNMITCYTDTLIQDYLQRTISQINKNETSGKGNLSEGCLFSSVLWVLEQRRSNTLSGFAGVLPSTEISLKSGTHHCVFSFPFCVLWNACCVYLTP